jgi:peptidylprolyl isomerase
MPKKKNTTPTIQKGDTVTLHYTGTLEDGTEFDSSRTRDQPMEVVVGTGQLIKGFDAALLEMKQGETKTFTVDPDEAYGDVNPEATTDLPKHMFPDDFEFTEDMMIPLTGPGGRPYMSRLVEVRDEDITVDLNHPMAGKTLTFEVEVLGVSAGEETTS